MARDECRYGAVLLLVCALALGGCTTGGGSTAAAQWGQRTPSGHRNWRTAS